MKFNVGNYSKFLIAVQALAVQALVIYPHFAKWTPIITGGISALLLLLVPNTPKVPVTPAPVAEPITPEMPTTEMPVVKAISAEPYFPVANDGPATEPVDWSANVDTGGMPK